MPERTVRFELDPTRREETVRSLSGWPGGLALAVKVAGEDRELFRPGEPPADVVESLGGEGGAWTLSLNPLELLFTSFETEFEFGGEDGVRLSFHRGKGGELLGVVNGDVRLAFVDARHARFRRIHKGIEVFWAIGGDQLSDIGFLAGFSRLRELELQGCYSLADLDGLAGLANLVRVSLRHCPSLADLGGLARLTELAGLELWGCESLASLDALAGLGNLREFVLWDSESLVNADALGHLANLTKLTLYRCGSLTEGSFLARLVGLRELDLSSCESLADLSPIRGLTALARLNLGSHRRIAEVDVLAGLVNLAALRLDHCKSLINVHALANMARLARLDLSSCESLASVDGLAGLSCLTHLDLCWCRSLTSVNALAGLGNLEVLKLANCKRLTSVSSLAGLRKLAAVLLDGCPHVTSLAPLESCPALAELRFDREGEAWRVLAECAVLRGDGILLWGPEGSVLEACRRAPDRSRALPSVARALALGRGEPWALGGLRGIMEILRDVELTEEALAETLSALGEAGDTAHVREIAELCLEDGEGSGADAPAIRIRAYLGALPGFPGTARGWALGIAERLTAPAREDRALLDATAASVVLFHARMDEGGKLDEWLGIITSRPERPGAGDAAFAALARHFLGRGEGARAMEHAGRVKSAAVRDGLSAEFARHYAEREPALAGGHLAAISDAALRRATAAGLAGNPEVTGHVPNLYALVMSLQGDPQALGGLLASVVERHPEAAALGELARPAPGPASADALAGILGRLADAGLVDDAEAVLGRLDADARAQLEKAVDGAALRFLVKNDLAGGEDE